MSKKIEDISIFGEYKQPENRVTAAFLQICKIGGEDFIRHISQVLGFLLPESEISIISQAAKRDSSPDGLLESNFSFRLYLESKVKKNSVDKNQLNNHKKLIKNKSDYLVYLTPDEKKPTEISKLNDVYWGNWLTITEAFDKYIQNQQVQNLPLLEFLIGHFKTLLDNMGLIGTKWDLNNDKVLIVAASSAENVAINYNV